MLSLFKKKPMLELASQEKIVNAIKEAEKNTSGEIRVYMEHHCEYMDALHRAQELFEILKMNNTEAQNAILIYVALTDRQFALFGGKTIYEKAGGAQFWKNAAYNLSSHLKKNEVAEGIADCIKELGKELTTHFPLKDSENKNELPDEIVFGK